MTSIKKTYQYLRSMALLLLLVMMTAQHVLAAEITSIDFKYGKPKSTLVVKADGVFEYEKSESEDDHQVIIDIKNSTVPKNLARKTDTSQFKSNIALVSTYQKEGDVRIVMQLKAKGDVELAKNNADLVASIENGPDASGTEISEQTEKTPEADTAKAADEAAAGNPETAKTTEQNASQEQATVANASPITIDTDTIESFMESQNSKKFVGTKITIQMMDASLQDIFRIIANASEFNIILSERVTGRMSLDLVDVPWDQVLDIVLKSNRLSAERVANILRVLPSTDLQQEKDLEVQARVAAEVAEPLVSKIFPISYANPTDISRILTPYLSRDPRQVSVVRGNIEIDRRTNALIVRETPSTIEKFKRLIKELDTQTPQVLIEGKFVEVSESHSRDFQAQLYSTTRLNRAGVFDFHPDKNNYGLIFGSGGLGGSATSALALAPATGGVSMGFAPKAALLPGFPDLAAILNVAEVTTSSKTISSPRIVTQNRTSATITQGQQIVLTSLGSIATPGTFQTVNATLNLTVEPQVTNEGSINLRINFSESSPGASVGSSALTTNTKSIDTQLLIDSGATIIIGGVYTSATTKSETGIPFLRDIPILGLLFGGTSNTTNKNELFIFITPRVLNEKEAGLRT